MKRAQALACMAGITLAGAAGCAHRPPQLPAGMAVEEIAIPWQDAFPSDLVVDRAGRVWFTDRLTHVIGRYDPETRSFERYPTPTPKSGPYGFVASPDGVLWFAESTAGRIGRIDPTTAQITEYVVPELEDNGPHLLAWSADRLWFTARGSRRWGWLDPKTGTVTSFALPEPAAGTVRTGARRFAADMGTGRPYGIAPAPGGVWIGTYDGPQFFRVRAGADTLEEFRMVRPLPVDSARLRRLDALADSLLRGRRAQLDAIADTAERRRRERAMEPDSVFRLRVRGGMAEDRIGMRRAASDAGGHLWVGDFGRGRIARFDPQGNTLEVFPFLDERGTATYGIGVDRWGRVWSYQMYRSRLTMIDPATGERATATIRSSGTVRHIAFDPQRARVWLPISDSGRLGLLELGK